MSEGTKRKRAADSPQDEEQAVVNRRRDKLLDDVSALRLLLSKAEASDSAAPFRDIVLPENLFPASSRVSRPPDPQIVLQTELHALAGVRTEKAPDGFVFGFGRAGASGPSYRIQLWSESGVEWRLGRWVLPMSVDATVLIREYPIDSPLSIKRFLRECKRRVDCYERRKSQCRELTIFTADLNLSYCCVQAEPCFTRILLKVAVRDDTRRASLRIVVVDLRYRSNETLPTRMIVESDDLDSPLNDEETKRTRLLFKAFKDHNLREAAVKIFTSKDNENVWKLRDDLSDSELEPDNEIDARSRKRRKRVVESDREAENESALSGGPTDDDVSATGVSSRPASSHKRKKPASDAPTSRGKRKIVKKSAEVQKIGNSRELEGKSETKENPPGRVGAEKKGVKKSAKKSAVMKKIGNSRELEEKSETKENLPRRVGAEKKGVKKSAKKSAEMKKIGNSRELEEKSETKENLPGRVGAEKKGVKKSAKKSAEVKKNGNSRELEEKSETKENLSRRVGAEQKGVKKSAKKSAEVKKIGKNRLEAEAETMTTRRGDAGKKSVKESSPVAGQAKLSRYFSPGKNLRDSSPGKERNDRAAASGKLTKNSIPCSTPIVGRAARLNLDDDISEIVRVLDKDHRDDDDDDDDEKSPKTRQPRKIANQTELLRDVRAVRFADDHIEKPPKRIKAAGGTRRKSAIKKK